MRNNLNKGLEKKNHENIATRSFGHDQSDLNLNMSRNCCDEIVVSLVRYIQGCKHVN